MAHSTPTKTKALPKNNSPCEKPMPALVTKFDKISKTKKQRLVRQHQEQGTNVIDTRICEVFVSASGCKYFVIRPTKPNQQMAEQKMTSKKSLADLFDDEIVSTPKIKVNKFFL
jgi:GTP-binding protein EngB required for normal cell division